MVKRKASGRYGKVYKRRRRSVRQRFRRARAPRNKTWTSQSGSGNQMQYKSRKLRKSAWRRKLWNDTLGQQHYRSSGNGVANIESSNTQGVGNVSLQLPTFIGTPGPTTAFWTATGGLVLTDQGANPVQFAPTDLVIRGGRIGIIITCPDDVTEELAVTIYVIQIFNEPDYSLLPALVSYGSMVDAEPDFNRRFARVLYNKSATMNNTYSSFSLEHRLRVQKIDQETHGTALGGQIGFLVTVTPLQSSPVTPYELPSLVYHDLSFTGDAIDNAAA